MLRGSKADELITLVFMAFAIISGVCLLFSGNRIYFLIFGGIAILIRVVQYILRYFK